MSKYDQYEIEHFPIQKGGELRFEKGKYPWQLLDEVGKGFWIPPHCATSPVRSAASQWGKAHGVKFMVRKIGERRACIRIA